MYELRVTILKGPKEFILCSDYIDAMVQRAKLNEFLREDKIKDIDHVVFLCLEFDKLKINSMFWILDYADECYDIILGRNSQKKNKLYIDSDDDGLYMKRDGKTPHCVAAPVNVPTH